MVLVGIRAIDPPMAILCIGIWLISDIKNWIKMNEYESKRGEYISSHMLADFRKSPAIFKGKWIDKELPDVDTPAFLLGRAFHCMVLEGDEKFAEEYDMSSPVNEKTGKPYGQTTNKYEEWANSVKAQGKTPLPPEMAALATAMKNRIYAHQKAALLLSGERKVEKSLYSTMLGRKIMGRLDLIACDRIVDLKTCGDLDWFEADIGRYGYARQMAFYKHLCGQDGIEVWLIGVEKSYPHRVGVWKLSETVLTEAHDENLSDMAKLIQCETTGLWPTGYEAERIVFGI